MKRALCVILIISMLLSMLAGCSDGDSAKHDDTIVVDGLTIDTTKPDRTGLYDLYWIPLPTGTPYVGYNEIAYDSTKGAVALKTLNDLFVSYAGELVIPIYHWGEEHAAYKGNVPLSMMHISLEDFAYQIVDLEWLDGEFIVTLNDDVIHCNLIRITPVMDGGYFGILLKPGTNGGRPNFVRWDSTGKRVYTIDIVDAIQKAGNKEILPDVTEQTEAAYRNTALREYGYFIDSNGMLYIMSKSKVAVWSLEGEFIHSISIADSNRVINDPAKQIVVTEDGEGGLFYFNRNSQRKVYEYALFDGENGKTGNTVELPSSVTDVVQLASGFDAYQITSIGVQAHRYDADPVILLNWVDYDLKYDNIVTVKVVNANKIFILYRDAETGELKPGVFSATNIEGQIAEQMSAYKTELTLAYIAGSSTNAVKTIENYVTEFNLGTSDYRIKMLAYTPVGNQSAEDMLISDILSGKIPDMILFDYEMNYRKFDNMNLFCDIYDFMDKDDTYTRDAFYNCVKVPFENADGELPFMTVQFGISSMVMLKESVGKKTSWSISEMADYMLALDEGRCFVNLNTENQQIDVPMTLLTQLLPNTIGHYVDYDHAKASLGDDLAKLLELCKKVNVYLSVNGAIPPMYSNGEILSLLTGLRSQYPIRDVQGFIADQHRYFAGKDVTYIGYPTEGECGSVIVPMTSLAITKKGINPDGAWEFVKSCFDYQYAEWEYTVDPQEITNNSYILFTLPTGFSGVRSTVEQMCETLKHYFFTSFIRQSPDNPNRLSYSGSFCVHLAADGSYGENDIIKDWLKEVDRSIYIFTNEDKSDLIWLLDNITIARNFDSDLLDIIYEDASYYFASTKSLEETVRIIENRVGIKLAE